MVTGMGEMYNKDNIAIARKLRKDMTREERKLWYECLRELPVRFYRQKPIGNYVADFYCPKLHLVIELDGSQHYQDKGIVYDTERRYNLNELHERMNLGECQANTMAAIILMPKELLTASVRRHFRKSRIPVYGDCVFLPEIKPVMQAMAMPDASIVRILLIPSSLKMRWNSAPIASSNSTSSWWFKKQSTFSTLPGRTCPSSRIRCSKSFI